ncbi:MAG: hypothetical protein K1W08_15525, partial [Lachnospiraceae bacterium]
ARALNKTSLLNFLAMCGSPFLLQLFFAKSILILFYGNEKRLCKIYSKMIGRCLLIPLSNYVNMNERSACGWGVHEYGGTDER